MQEGKRCSWRWLWNVQIFYRYFTARAKPFATRLTTTRFLSRKNCSPRLENMNLDAITANVLPVFKYAGSGLKSKLIPSLLSFLGLFRKRPTFTVGPWDMYKGQEYQHGRFYNSTCNFSWEIKIQQVCRFSISKRNSQESESKKASDNGTNRTHTPYYESWEFRIPKSVWQGRDHYQQARPSILSSRIHNNQSRTLRARLEGTLTQRWWQRHWQPSSDIHNSRTKSYFRKLLCNWVAGILWTWGKSL